MTMKTTRPRPVLPTTGIDRAGQERLDPDLVERLRADSGTHVLVVQDDRAALTADRTLRFVAPGDVRENAQWAFLGRDAEGAGLLVAALSADATVADDAQDCAASAGDRTGLALLAVCLDCPISADTQV